jgi:hypothetical protein
MLEADVRDQSETPRKHSLAALIFGLCDIRDRFYNGDARETNLVTDVGVSSVSQEIR